MKKTIKNAISKVGAAIRNLLSFCFAFTAGIAVTIIKAIISSPKYLFDMIAIPIAFLAASVGIYGPLRLLSGEAALDVKKATFTRVFFFSLISPVLLSLFFLKSQVKHGYESGKKAFDKSNSVLNSFFKPLIDCFNAEPVARNTASQVPNHGLEEETSINAAKVNPLKVEVANLKETVSKVIAEHAQNKRETITESPAKPIQFAPTSETKSLHELAQNSLALPTSVLPSDSIIELYSKEASLVDLMHKLQARF